MKTKQVKEVDLPAGFGMDPLGKIADEINKEIYQCGFEDGKKVGVEWESIETAPLDTMLLLFNRTDERVYIGWRVITVWDTNDDGTKIALEEKWVGNNSFLLGAQEFPYNYDQEFVGELYQFTKYLPLTDILALKGDKA